MKKYILGISAYYHDSAVSLLEDGKVIFCVQEERFTRVKHDKSFPTQSLSYLIEEYGLNLCDISYIAFYDKPFIKFERLLETYSYFAPRGIGSFIRSMPVWIKEKLLLKSVIKKELKKFSKKIPKILFSEHHLSHAASAFFPSPYEEAAILTMDGVGEWATTSLNYGYKNTIEVKKELHFPHSLGLLYSAFTYYCGFKVNSGEYKLMGLAPYGDRECIETKEFIKKIKSSLIDLKEDGSFLMNMDYFDYATGSKMCSNKWSKLFGIDRRDSESALNDSYMNLALACQLVTEEIILKLAKTIKELTGSDNLVLAGGVALNCVANGSLVKENIFKNIWIQPAAGDAGGSLGAALCVEHIYLERKRIVDVTDSMQSAYLGPSYSDSYVEAMIRKYNAKAITIDNYESLYKTIAKELQKNKVVGWHQDRSEFGPRALGNRSILANPMSRSTQKNLNLKIKFRESFRPFAPAILEEDCAELFELEIESPYMLLVSKIKNQLNVKSQKEDYLEKLYLKRSELPAVTHIDYSSRIQTVSKTRNIKFWSLINEFKKLTDCPALVNTSFNVRGEPISLTPKDSYLCFMRTDMDILVINNYIFYKKEQKKLDESYDWRKRYKLD